MSLNWIEEGVCSVFQYGGEGGVHKELKEVGVVQELYVGGPPDHLVHVAELHQQYFSIDLNSTYSLSTRLIWLSFPKMLSIISRSMKLNCLA